MTLATVGFRAACRDCSRHAVDHPHALALHAASDSRLSLAQEAFLSHFTFPQAFRTHLADMDTTSGYAGPVYAGWVFADIDRPGEPAAALADARRLAGVTLDTCRTLDDDGLLVFFSGQKGYHVGFPVGATGSGPSDGFHLSARSLWEALADTAGVRIDTSIYTTSSLLRAPNTRHPKTGLYKVRLLHRELMHLPADRIHALAAGPVAFDLPDPTTVPPDPTAVALWGRTPRRDASRRVDAYNGSGTPLQRGTLDFIHGSGVPLREGERNTRVMGFAANLTEAGVPEAVVHQLLTDPARDTGLPPGEVRKAIAGGIAHQQKAV